MRVGRATRSLSDRRPFVEVSREPLPRSGFVQYAYISTPQISPSALSMPFAPGRATPSRTFATCKTRGHSPPRPRPARSRRNGAERQPGSVARRDTRQRGRHSSAITASWTEDEVPATADADSLRRFLEGEVLPWFEARRKELANRPLIRDQTLGEALDPNKLERLAAMRSTSTASSNACSPILLRLQDLRRTAETT